MRHDVDRTAVAVTEEAPYSIEVVEPKVPLVQNGSMNLKVVAKRQAGFKGADHGATRCGPRRASASQASAVIPEGQTEALLPMNAAPNAAAAEVEDGGARASPTRGKGPVWMSSQLVTLEVAAAVRRRSRWSGRPSSRARTTQLFCKVAVATPFEGKAKVKLLGLPAR